MFNRPARNSREFGDGEMGIEREREESLTRTDRSERFSMEWTISFTSV